MKAQLQLFVWAFAVLTIAANVACSNNGGSSNGGAASASAAISITPNPAIVAAGQTLLITPSGGTSPYSYSLLSNIGGTLAQSNGTFTILTAGSSSGTVQLTVVDSAGATGVFLISVSGTSSGSMVISPMAITVAPGGTVNFTASGGVGTYSYLVLTSGGGSFNGSVFTAPSTQMVSTVQVSDSAGHMVQTTVNVSGSTTTASGCAGNYSLNLAGYPGTLTILQDNAGNIAGSLTITGYGSPAAISGTCNGGVITFTDLWSSSAYSGSYFQNASNLNQTVMSGTFNDPNGTFSWFAISQ